MLYRISSKMRDSLLASNESGMGYQLVRSNGYHYIVLNALLGMDAEASWVPHLPDLQTLEKLFSTPDWEDTVLQLLKGAELLPYGPDYALETDDTQASWDHSSEGSEAESESGLGFDIESHGSYVSHPRPDEEFVRFSAFSNDLRIGSDGSIRAGTYATTLNDSRIVPSGLAAVGRYALPNPLPARYGFRFSAPANATIHCGVVRPRYGQAGGGVEVRFQNPLPAGSVTKRVHFRER